VNEEAMSATTATGPAGFSKKLAVAHALSRRRKRINAVIKVLCLIATAIGLLALASILATLLWRGIGGLSLTVFTTSTLPPGSGGGLLNAIVGSLIQTLLGAAIGTPIGMLAGTWLAEYARDSRLGDIVRFISDVLLSARLIPTGLREAVIALGAPKWKMIVLVCYRAARQGIATGVLLAVARIAGETAPLLFTSLGNLNWSGDLTKPMASLPVTIFQYAGSAFEDWVTLAMTQRQSMTGRGTPCRS
jgi:phosphate transport system permease protein